MIPQANRKSGGYIKLSDSFLYNFRSLFYNGIYMLGFQITDLKCC